MINSDEAILFPSKKVPLSLIKLKNIPSLYNRNAHSMDDEKSVEINSKEAHFSNRVTINNETFPPNIIHVTDEIIHKGTRQDKVSIINFELYLKYLILRY